LSIEKTSYLNYEANMRIFIDVRDDLMEELLREANTGVKKEAITLAIKTFLDVKRREKLASLVGKYELGYSRKQHEEMR
jgi:Arc/MetJ family transcription regulator